MAAKGTEKEETEFKTVPEPPLSLPSIRRFTSKTAFASIPVKNLKSQEEVVPEKEVQAVRRCFGCRKKVGLTGFRCRCGDLFCSEHRYSDRHVCGYDYKAAGREAIAKENPVVKAAKIIRL